VCQSSNIPDRVHREVERIDLIGVRTARSYFKERTLSLCDLTTTSYIRVRRYSLRYFPINGVDSKNKDRFTATIKNLKARYWLCTHY